MSTQIHKITKEGKTIFPATTTDAVVHPSLRAEVTKIFTEYNVSALFPTNGIDSGDKYNLALAISILSNHLEAEQKNPGTKMIFKNKDNQVESWKFNGTELSHFTNSGYWTLEGLADEKSLPQVKTIKFVRGLDEENNPVIIDQADLLSSLNNINKGYFPTVEELRAKYPTANLGDIAFVGTKYPYAIWRWNGEEWVDTGETGGQEDVDLNNYYTKPEVDEKFKENGAIIPTLPVAPGESTTTWTDEEEIYNFKIGQFARVIDAKQETGYRFYQLYDISSDGKAKWNETGIEYDVVTLDSIPGESTLSWSNGVETISFKVGQQVRVDSGNATSDKVFYQLYDIKNGLAVWEKVNLDYSPVTLSTPPTEATLTWKLGNIVNEFEIGQQVRVEKEPGTEEYVFYQLYDIKNGLAVWKEAGSGSGSDITWDDISKFLEIVTLLEAPTKTTLTWTDSEDQINKFRIGQQARVLKSDGTYDIYQLYDIKNGTDAVWKLIDIYEVITVSSEPTESTLSWNNNGIDTKFKVGQQVRYLKDGNYVFYQLYDIQGGTRAIWKKPVLSGDEIPQENIEEVKIGTIAPGYDDDCKLFVDTTNASETGIEVYTKTEIDDLLKDISSGGGGSEPGGGDVTQGDLDEINSRIDQLDSKVTGIDSTVKGHTSSISSLNNSVQSNTTKINSLTTKLPEGVNNVTTLYNLPVNKSVIIANLSSATNLSVSSGMYVGQSITILCIPSNDFTQSIPNNGTSGTYVSLDGDSISVTNGKIFEINILCYNTGKYSISCKVSK